MTEAIARPREDEQVALRADLAELHSVLVARAAVLIRGLRPPRPEPSDVVNTVAARLLRKYRDADIQQSTRQLAFRVLSNIVIDFARRSRETLLEDATAVADERPGTPDPMLRKVLSELPEQQRCVAWRIAVEGVAVPAAFVACGWTTPSPYAEYKKILKSLRARLEVPA